MLNIFFKTILLSNILLLSLHPSDGETETGAPSHMNSLHQLQMGSQQETADQRPLLDMDTIMPMPLHHPLPSVTSWSQMEEYLQGAVLQNSSENDSMPIIGKILFDLRKIETDFLLSYSTELQKTWEKNNYKPLSQNLDYDHHPYCFKREKEAPAWEIQRWKLKHGITREAIFEKTLSYFDTPPYKLSILSVEDQLLFFSFLRNRRTLPTKNDLLPFFPFDEVVL